MYYYIVEHRRVVVDGVGCIVLVSFFFFSFFFFFLTFSFVIVYFGAVSNQVVLCKYLARVVWEGRKEINRYSGLVSKNHYWLINVGICVGNYGELSKDVKFDNERLRSDVIFTYTIAAAADLLVVNCYLRRKVLVESVTLFTPFFFFFLFIFYFFLILL